MTDFSRLAREYLESKFPNGDPVEIDNDHLASSLVKLERDSDVEERTTEAVASPPRETDEGAAPDTPSPSTTTPIEEPLPLTATLPDTPDPTVEDNKDSLPNIGGDVGSLEQPELHRDRPSQLSYDEGGSLLKESELPLEFEEPDLRLEKEADVFTDLNPGIQDTTIVPKDNEEFTKMLDDIDKRVVVPEYKSPDEVVLPQMPPLPDVSVLVPNAADAHMSEAGQQLMNWERQ